MVRSTGDLSHRHFSLAWNDHFSTSTQKSVSVVLFGYFSENKKLSSKQYKVVIIFSILTIYLVNKTTEAELSKTKALKW